MSDFAKRMHFDGPSGYGPCTRTWPHDGPCAHPPRPMYLGWTWRAHFDDLHKSIVEGRWMIVAAKLSKMTAYAIEKALKG